MLGKNLVEFRKVIWWFTYVGIPIIIFVVTVDKFDSAWFSSQNQEKSSDSEISLFFFGIGVAFSILTVGIGNIRDPYNWTNYRVQSQIDATSRLLFDCREQLIIFSGEFHNSVYQSEAVVGCFEMLPEDVEVFLFYNNDEVDSKSSSLRSIARERGWTFQHIPLKGVNHFMIVDKCDIRMEKSTLANGDPQFARYIKCRPDYAKRILKNFKNRIATSKIPNPKLMPKL